MYVDKCNRKHLDYDRYFDAVKNLKAKTKLTPQEDRDLINVNFIAKLQQEQKLKEAGEIYENFNQRTKEDFPKIFKLRQKFSETITKQFTQLQLSINAMLVDLMQKFVALGYYDMNMQPLQSYSEKSKELDLRVSGMASLQLIEKKTEKSTAATSSLSAKPTQSVQPIQPVQPTEPTEPTQSSLPPPSFSDIDMSEEFMTQAFAEDVKLDAPPVLDAYSHSSNDTAISEPPADPNSKRVVALFDFEAQSPEDLSFHKGDVIELVKSTEFQEDWWTGRLGDRVGNFPGNYVKTV